LAPILEVKGLTTHFRTRDGTIQAVNGVSFDLDEGETIGIVGESGSGKSVTSLSILRLLPTPPAEIVEGEINFEGRDLLEMDERDLRKIRGAQISMIFQDPISSLNPVMRISEQLLEPLTIHMGLKGEVAYRRAVELLRAVGIPDPERRIRGYPHEFSGGMRQRVMIAIAIAANPKVLIADEPTTALDVTVQAQILDLIGTLRRDLHTAVMLITHDLGVVAGIADRILVMYAGHIVERAPTNELFANPRHPYTLGLLASVPRLDDVGTNELQTIAGAPPDMLNPPQGCPFQPRCPFAIAKCQIFPPDEIVGHQHKAACWVDVTDPAEIERATQRGFIPLRSVGGSFIGETVGFAD
jgi:oligopeptide transport system ATP-binding protein